MLNNKRDGFGRTPGPRLGLHEKELLRAVPMETDTPCADSESVDPRYRWATRASNASSSPAIEHSPHLTRPIMSNNPSPSTSRSNLDAIFNTALRTYKNKTGKDITSHPLATELQSCDSPDTILAVLRRQMPNADQSQKADETFEKCLIPTVNVLYTLSGTLGAVAGLVIITTSSILRICAQTCFLKVFPPANIIFTGIGALLLVG